MQAEAEQAALALVRQAIEFSDASGPSGNVMDVVGRYLAAAHRASGAEPGAEFNAGPAFRTLLVALAQFGGATYKSFVEARSGRPVSKTEVLAALDDIALGMIADPPEPNN